MTGLLSLLGQAAGSLGTTQSWTSTVSQNLTNANTPGYSRQSANIAAVLPADMIGNSYLGMGSVLQSVTQSRDRFVEAQMSGALGNQSYSSAQMNALQSITSFDTGNGIGPALSTFYSKLSALAQDPGSASLREAAVASASTLTNTFNSTATELAGTRSALDSQITGKLSEINTDAAQVAQLNLQIRQAKANGGSPNDLLDARQKLADRLSTLTGAHNVANSEEDMNLVLPGGVSLVSAGQSAVLSTQPDPANRGHVALYAKAPDGSGPSLISNQPGGELGGLFAARDGGLKTAEASVDQLAFDLGTSLNTVHSAGYALDGTTGRPLFNMAATSLGAAGTISVNQAITGNVSLLAASSSAATVPGDHTNLQAMIDTQSVALSTGSNPIDTFSGITAAYGTSAASAQAVNEGDSAILTNVTAMRASVSGVSIDEEMISLQQAQRSYEAITKVISTANTMLDALMALR